LGVNPSVSGSLLNSDRLSLLLDDALRNAANSAQKDTALEARSAHKQLRRELATLDAS